MTLTPFCTFESKGNPTILSSQVKSWFRKLSPYTRIALTLLNCFTQQTTRDLSVYLNCFYRLTHPPNAHTAAATHELNRKPNPLQIPIAAPSFARLKPEYAVRCDSRLTGGLQLSSAFLLLTQDRGCRRFHFCAQSQ